ncbi:hypothetical protein ACPOL_5718 [Acidisarcina polymorpha]|uniref:Uncharacterized protein n=1 Tax=Acidisarcina polymorpha TaxID=2211140 RepID=A0A2Z5G8D5_9BACT|nr:hypothetical protein [Acidisarcina polymorpha]AXC14964.1 hypothetical protein ACPOL_5718 [Acidisarcina polymorpha]
MKRFSIAALLILLFTSLCHSARACDRNVSFAIAEKGLVLPLTPDFVTRWVSQHRRNYPGVCFSQQPQSGKGNFLIVFSASRAGLSGVHPTVRPGAGWSFGVSSGETGALQPSTGVIDRDMEVFAFVYDQRGVLVFQELRRVVSDLGGESYNAIGKDLGSSSAAIRTGHALLKGAIEDIQRCYEITGPEPVGILAGVAGASAN